MLVKLVPKFFLFKALIIASCFTVSNAHRKSMPTMANVSLLLFRIMWFIISITSAACLFLTKPYWCSWMTSLITLSSLLATMPLQILYIEFSIVRGLQAFIFSGSLRCFGKKITRPSGRDSGIILSFNTVETIVLTIFLTFGQNLYRNAYGMPSGPGAFPSFISLSFT